MGLGPYLQKYVTEPQHVFLRRWKNGKVIGHTKLGADFRARFDAPYWVIPRHDYHKALHDMARDLGVTVKLGSKVVSYDSAAPTITLEGGQVISADLIVAADGMLQQHPPRS